MPRDGAALLHGYEKVVRFLPPLNVRDDELEEALDILDDALDMLYGEEAEEAEAEETPEAEA